MGNEGCTTCSGPSRETVGMVCQTCGTDYGSPPHVEALARALAVIDGLNPDGWSIDPHACGRVTNWDLYSGMSDSILYNPAPLLAALAECGILGVEEREVIGYSRWVSDWMPKDANRHE